MLHSPSISRLLVLAWLTLCLAVLTFGVLQRSIHDMPVTFTWFMLFLSAPVGFVVIPLTGIATSSVSSAFGVSYNPVFDLLPLWVAAVVFGYIQWFITVPWLVRKVFRER